MHRCTGVPIDKSFLLGFLVERSFQSHRSLARTVMLIGVARVCEIVFVMETENKESIVTAETAFSSFIVAP